ncbi:permease-like cell division protein FtsX [Salirhabdus sp. Marseille-P4669]|uniref:permease-like cell division protein FtsX n=1 Tax=Salirhabdus sp. Marseille-P4669 TaxID=2042310 RepID=UPI000C79F602|nr:permease-like cell division protein FtsX [Salirhabdus sp. Marseille-P4669]
MKLKTLKRHFVEGSKNIVRNGWMTVASVGSVTTTLILVSVFLVLIFNLNTIATNVEEDVEIKVYIDLAADQAAIDKLESQIKTIEEVSYLQFSSKENELEELIADLGEEGEYWGMFEQDNPLNDAFVVKTEDPLDIKKVATSINKFDNVFSVEYGEEVIQKLFKFNEYARYIGIALIAALILTAGFLISNTIKITIIARSREINIMKLVGATNGFIRWPFFIEGLLMGLLGAIIPVVVVLVGYHYLYDSLQGVNFPYFELLPYNPFAWQIALILLGIGAVIGMWGSVMSVRKFLKV